METAQDQADDRRIAGWLLASTAVAFVAFMGHHPDSSSAPALVRAIHGVILLTMIGQALGFLYFARWFGSVGAWAGFFVFALAIVAGGGAGLINGFLVPAAMENLPVATSKPLFRLLWEANQVLAQAGVLLTSIAYLIWAGVLHRRAWPITAATALIAAVLPVVLLTGNLLTMNILGAQLVYGLQALWAVGLGVVLLRRG